MWGSSPFSLLWSCMIPRIVSFVKALIAPPFCISCKLFIQTNQLLCLACSDQIEPIATTKIPITKKYQVSLFAISDYKDPLRKLILKKAYKDRLASEQLGNLLWEHSDIRYADFDIIVPVPLHWTKYSWRWFNQSEEIAKVIAQKTNKPVVHLLKRVQKTQAQAGLTRAKRFVNVEKAFALSDDAYNFKYKKILLIDDVMTTGTTLQSCFRQLIKLSPLVLLGSVICRRV
jgi:ComF family protein